MPRQMMIEGGGIWSVDDKHMERQKNRYRTRYETHAS